MLKNLEAAVLGFTIVMVVMAAITIIMMLMPYFTGGVKKEKKNHKKEQEKHTESTEKSNLYNTSDNSELIAVITAAINAYSKHENKSLRVVSFKRVGDSSPAWNMVSRVNNI